MLGIRVHKTLNCLIAAALLTTFSSGAIAADAMLSEAQRLLSVGDAKSAYALLAPAESERAGDVEYDYLLGIAALDSGNPSRGMFALERVLAVQPDNAQARAEIARAHFMLGEHDSARAEFKNVLEKQPPEAAIATINRYMSAIDRALGETTRFGAYLEFTLGHDSNINSAPSPGQVVANIGGIPLPVNISGLAAEKSSKFASWGGGANFQHPFDKQWTLLGSISGNMKANWADGADTFDTDSRDLSLGLRYQKGAEIVSANLQDSNFSLNSTRYRHTYGVIGQWQHNLDDHNQVNVFGQLMRLEYPGASIRDADRRVIGAGYGHAFSGDLSPVVFVSAYLGEEEERHSDVPFLGHDLYGVRAGGQITWNPRTVFYASASYENRDYGGTKPFFTKSQEDDQFDINIGARFMPIARWQIKPQFSYTRNDSNIAITDFDRYMVSVSFRHDFEW